MTHLRNWVLKDCEDVMDSDGLNMVTKFMIRYKYKRPAKVKHQYLACEISEVIK